MHQLTHIYWLWLVLQDHKTTEIRNISSKLTKLNHSVSPLHSAESWIPFSIVVLRSVVLKFYLKKLQLGPPTEMT